MLTIRHSSGATSIENICHLTTTILRNNNDDIKYALLYLVENQKSESNYKPERVRLESTTFDDGLVPIKRADGSEEYVYVDGLSSRCIPDNLLSTPDLIVLPNSEEIIDNVDAYTTTAKPWPIERVIFSGDNVVIKLPDNSTAILCPVTSLSEGKDVLTAVMICGINQHRALDKEFREFIQVCLSMHRGNMCLQIFT
jgi:hypothetical protein